MNVLDKIKKACTIKEAALLEKSIVFNERDMISTSISVLNIAFSGKIDGGFSSGITTWAGTSKMFKTGFSLLMAKSFLDKYPDACLLLLDSEFGSPKNYFESFGLDLKRIYHVPITDIEQLKFELMQQLSNFEREDKVIIIIDSIGNLASKKEVEDALDGKTAADLTRSKQLKSLFRMITPHLIIKDIPLIVVNHVYKEIGLYPKDIIGGGTGSVYSSDNIYILGRQQEKDGTELSGYNFIINVEKSRFVKEKSKIPISITFDRGVSKYSGLLDIALELGWIVKPNVGWYSKVNKVTGEIEEKKYRAKDTNTKEFWESILNSQAFKDDVYNRYSISSHSIFSDEEIEEEFKEIAEETND